MRRRQKKLLYSLTALLTLLGAASALLSATKISAANYQRIHFGMSRGNVEAVLGKPTSCYNTQVVGLPSTEQCHWKNEMHQEIVISFDEHHKVATKTGGGMGGSF